MANTDNEPKIYEYKNIKKVVERLRSDLKDVDNILLFAHNRTGKTRLSMEFKDIAKEKGGGKNTLYFNAFTEDLFSWDNDLENDTSRRIKMNKESAFFKGLQDLPLEDKIRDFLNKYVSFNFKINYDEWWISFSSNEEEDFKISRGEESIFIWCFFLAIVELAMDAEIEAYNWVKYVYIDDPISSLDDENAIAVATDLCQLLERGKGKIKTIISTHHSLFHNVIWNESKNRHIKRKTYFFHRPEYGDIYTLRKTGDTPFFHHIAMLAELKKAADTGKIYTYHFNGLRNIMEKIAAFRGYDNFEVCIEDIKEKVLFNRIVQLLSHGKYSVYEPTEMVEDNKELFRKILNKLIERYGFQLPKILKQKENEEIK